MRIQYRGIGISGAITQKYRNTETRHRFSKDNFSAVVALQALSPVYLQGSNTANQSLLDSTLDGAVINASLYGPWQARQGFGKEGEYACAA